ncbi:Hypothetical predicted protein [Xyrichtys novacula]|uniref:Uncharacterized protein n=1 Tax=Xyrichtys novacula TaxID=13765 RepID=A0AAV1FY39_XYRNO|nr:Hypothetical predicted protein [Xyrichtys novacula]
MWLPAWVLRVPLKGSSRPAERGAASGYSLLIQNITPSRRCRPGFAEDQFPRCAETSRCTPDQSTMALRRRPARYLNRNREFVEPKDRYQVSIWVQSAALVTSEPDYCNVKLPLL